MVGGVESSFSEKLLSSKQAFQKVMVEIEKPFQYFELIDKIGLKAF